MTLEIEHGEFIGILGETGSGKTTLLRLAAGLETPDKGSVTYQGRELDDIDETDIENYRREEVGCVWGKSQFYPGLSVLENVAAPLLFGKKDHRKAERSAYDALMTVDAENLASLKPAELTELECRRVSLAKALVASPRLLLVDELAHGLDFYEQDWLLATLQGLANDSKIAVLVVDSEAIALFRATPLLYLREGELLLDKRRKLAEVVDMPVDTSDRTKRTNA